MPSTKLQDYWAFQQELLEVYPARELRFAWPDLPSSTRTGKDSIADAVDAGTKLFTDEMELGVIISAASEDTLFMSDIEYRDALLRKIELWRATGAGALSSLVVRGSQRPAYGEPAMQERVDERYRQACGILKDADVALWLVADLYGESKHVLGGLDFKLSMQPSCLVVQPIKHWAGVTRETREGLARRLKHFGGLLQLVQLEETMALIANHRRTPDTLQVGTGGRDLYVYDPDVPGLVENLGKERIEALNVGIARWVLGPFLKNDKPHDFWWTRVGMGVGIEFSRRLAIMDKASPVFQVDASNPREFERMSAYIDRSKRGFTDAELRQWLIDQQLRTNYDFKQLMIE
ncbi:hypothetical protein [Marilutibacter spongiae]|uniref:Uncharacterized protein n=1 Tax=Marilutibacter spongiae TaxID=2025720 RepID=A0A7W3Y750_9GAMM|nr:hypothetical protein [Lysobacter spongiae]MBB1061799.1 hypothetical protein [Lysobacter spongiae]